MGRGGLRGSLLRGWEYEELRGLHESQMERVDSLRVHLLVPELDIVSRDSLDERGLAVGEFLGW